MHGEREGRGSEGSAEIRKKSRAEVGRELAAHLMRPPRRQAPDLPAAGLPAVLDRLYKNELEYRHNFRINYRSGKIENFGRKTYSIPLSDYESEIRELLKSQGNLRFKGQGKVVEQVDAAAVDSIPSLDLIMRDLFRAKGQDFERKLTRLLACSEEEGCLVAVKERLSWWIKTVKFNDLIEANALLQSMKKVYHSNFEYSDQYDHNARYTRCFFVETASRCLLVAKRLDLSDGGQTHQNEMASRFASFSLVYQFKNKMDASRKSEKLYWGMLSSVVLLLICAAPIATVGIGIVAAVVSLFVAAGVYSACREKHRQRQWQGIDAIWQSTRGVGVCYQEEVEQSRLLGEGMPDCWRRLGNGYVRFSQGRKRSATTAGRHGENPAQTTCRTRSPSKGLPSARPSADPRLLKAVQSVSSERVSNAAAVAA